MDSTDLKLPIQLFCDFLISESKNDIVFANTKKQDSVIKDRKSIARISRFGSPRMGGVDEAIKTFYFQGADNPITFSRIYDIRFICSYDIFSYIY